MEGRGQVRHGRERREVMVERDEVGYGREGSGMEERQGKVW